MFKRLLLITLLMLIPSVSLASFQGEYWQLRLDGIQSCPGFKKAETLMIYLHFWDDRSASAWTDNVGALGDQYDLSLQMFDEDGLRRFSASGPWRQGGWISLIGWIGPYRMAGRYVLSAGGCQGVGTFRRTLTWYVPE